LHESILILKWNRQSRKTKIWQRKAFLVLEYLCDFSPHFVQTKITSAIFLQINSWRNSKDFDIKFVIITPSESILRLNWNRQSRKMRIWQRKAFLVLEYLCDFSSHFVQTKITPAIISQINSWINSKDFDIKFVIITPSESILILNWNRQSRKTRIWQRKAFLVLEYLCDFSSHFVQTKITPAIFLQINSWINSKDFYIKFVIITPSESILIYSWIITNFQKHACLKQFVWACYNIFASFFALDVLFRTCSFICLRLFCHNRSFSPCLRCFHFTREPRIHWKKCGWKSRAHFTYVLSS